MRGKPMETPYTPPPRRHHKASRVEQALACALRLGHHTTPLRPTRCHADVGYGLNLLDPARE